MGLQRDKCLFHVCGELKKRLIKEETLIGLWRLDGISTEEGAQRDTLHGWHSIHKKLEVIMRQWLEDVHLPHKTAKAQVCICIVGKCKN